MTAPLPQPDPLPHGEGASPEPDSLRLTKAASPVSYPIREESLPRLDGTQGGPSAIDELGPPIWRNRPFMLLWAAQAISQTAQNAIWYGMMVLIQTRSHSATQMGLAIMTLIVPSVLFGVVAGAYVDRWDKRAVLIGTNALRAVITLGYILFADVQLTLVYGVNFLFSTVGQFFAPAEAATIPAIVPRRRLLQANSLFHLTFTASQLIGMVMLGPLVIKLAGEKALFGVVAGLIGLCAMLVWPLPRGSGAPRQEAEQAHSLAGLWQDIREVGAFIRGDGIVRLAVGHWTLAATLGIVIAMLAPGFAENVLGIGAEDSVFVLAPAGVGMFLATGLLGRFGHSVSSHRLITIGLLGVGGALIGLGLVRPLANLVTRAPAGGFELPPEATGPWLVAVVMFTTLLAGVAFVAIIVPAQTIIQERAPVAVRGRMFAVQLMLSNVVSIVPLLFLGGLADLIGIGQTLVLLGLGILVVGYLTAQAHRRLAASVAT